MTFTSSSDLINHSLTTGLSGLLSCVHAELRYTCALDLGVQSLKAKASKHGKTVTGIFLQCHTKKFDKSIAVCNVRRVFLKLCYSLQERL